MLSAIVRWRDWSIPVKLIAVVLVPVITTLALGFVVIDAQLGKADLYTGANGLTELSDSARSVISALQQERQQVAADEATMTPTSGMGSGGVSAALTGIQRQVDASLATLRQTEASSAARAGFDPVAATAWTDAQRQLSELTALRAQEGTATADAPSEIDTYSALIDGLFAFDRVLATDLGDAQLTREAIALYDLFSAREEVLYQQAVVLVGIGSGTMTVAEVTSLHGSEARLASRISDFRAVAAQDAAQDFQHMVTGPVLSQQGSLLDEAIDQSGGMSGQVMPGMVIRIPMATWNSANQAVTNGLTSVTDDLAGQLRGAASSLQSQASNAAGTAAVVLFVALLVAALVMVIVARQLLRSIGVLRRTARDVATRQLPEAVERIRVGETVDTEVTPVPVHTSDEVGQLARAFDAVHTEALKLAVEQANLRGNYSDLFTNLSRRSQGLVQRQLRLIEQLERDEEDPEQLSALFKLDHLATRMRRNNENLMVLSGGELGRGPSQAMPLSDLLRAAVSEIEQYQRVSLQPPPSVHILGYAAGDLVRLVAELLDNATAFSAPDTQVTIASHRTRTRAIVVDIVDHGIGMGDEELRAANERLSQPEGFEGRITRRMGLFVISRLAGQHGVRVRLHGGEDIPGLRVTVTLPAQLIVGDGEDLVLPAPTHEPLAAQPDPSTTAITVTIPQLPSAVASGVNLFAPLPGSATAAEGPAIGSEPDRPRSAEDRLAETTPIFDDMLSAWFDAAKPMDAPADDAASEDASFAGRSGWRFAADDGWRAADVVTQASPDAFTAAGLPKRQPKARLLPGSAVPTGAGAAPVGTAPSPPGAHKVRARLAGFQRGVQRGRHEIDTVGMPADEAIEQVDNTEQVGGVNPIDDQIEDAGRVDEIDGSAEDTAFFPPAALVDNVAEQASHEESIVDSVFTERPVDHREATGRTETVPEAVGSVQPAEGDPRDLPVRRRRPATGGTGANGSAAGISANGNAANGNAASAEPGSRNGAARTNGTAANNGGANNGGANNGGANNGGAANNSALVDTAIWPTVADEGWEAADDALDPTPSSYTEAGLPRRRPRAQLVPGSVATKGKPAMAGVDAGAVRDRLNSFQRGVRQGRDGSATAAADGIEHGFQWENE